MTFYYHPPGDMDDDAERELVTCSIARNSMYQIIDDAVQWLEDADEHTGRELFMYPVLWTRIIYTMDRVGFSARTGVRKRADHNRAFDYHAGKRELTWGGKTYPAPSSWRPYPVLRRRRGAPKPPKPRRRT